MSLRSIVPPGDSRFWAVVAAVAGIIVVVAVDRFERIALAEAAGASVTVMGFALSSFWSDRDQRWFWPFMSGAAVLHLIAVCAVPWPLHHVLTKGDILLMLPDMLLVLSVGWLTKRLLGGATEAHSA